MNLIVGWCLLSFCAVAGLVCRPKFRESRALLALCGAAGVVSLLCWSPASVWMGVALGFLQLLLLGLCVCGLHRELVVRRRRAKPRPMAGAAPQQRRMAG
jgi:hypothetical protein